MPICTLKAYYLEKVGDEHVIRFLCGSEEEHESFLRQIAEDSDVLICFGQYICSVDPEALLCPPFPYKGEEEMLKRLKK